MPMNSTSAFLKSALTLVLAGGFCSLILFPSARAQEGVAGDNPVISKPKQEPPADTKSSKNESQIRVTSNLVTAPVTVINSKGDFIFDLEEKDLRFWTTACASALNSLVWNSTSWWRSLWWKPIAPRSRCSARSAPSVRFSPA